MRQGLNRNPAMDDAGAGEYVGKFRDFSLKFRAMRSAIKEIIDPVIHCIRQIYFGERD